MSDLTPSERRKLKTAPGFTTDDQIYTALKENNWDTRLAAGALEIGVRQIQYRRRQLRLDGVIIPDVPTPPKLSYEPVPWTYPRRIDLSLRNSVIMCAGDMHKWPLSMVPENPVQSAFRKVAETLRPNLIVFDGDVIDATELSTHGRLRSQKTPKIEDEITAASDYMLSLPESRKILTRSNHDNRIDIYIANQAPRAEGLCMRLIDKLPGWETCYSVGINENTEIMHDWAGGIHAAHNNAMKSGRTFVTGHTHKLRVTPFEDLNGVRWGIECGMMAMPFEPQFEYLRGHPTQWQPGFVVLTYDAEGRLMEPEKCQWLHGRMWFRREPVDASIRIRRKAGSAAL